MIIALPHMNFVNELLYAGLIPLAVAAVAAYVPQRLRSPPPVAWSAGVGLGFVAGQLALASRSDTARILRSFVSPREASEWLPHAVLLALGITILASYAPIAWRRWPTALATLLAIGLPLRLLAGSIYVTQQWSMLEKISHLTLLSASLALVWLLLAAARDDELPRVRQCLLVLAAAGAAVVIALSGSITLGRQCGIVAAALTGSALVAPRGLSGAAGVVACSLGGLIILGVFYAGLQPANAALLMLSLAGAAGRLPDVVSSWPAADRVVLRVALCFVLLMMALAASLA